MAIKIVVSDKVKFGVKGTIRSAAGIDEPFGFNLIAKRMNADEIRSLTQSQEDQSLVDFFANIVEDWSGVCDADGKQLPYTIDNLRALFNNVPGLAALTFRTYLTEIGAKEKN